VAQPVNQQDIEIDCQRTRFDLHDCFAGKGHSVLLQRLKEWPRKFHGRGPQHALGWIIAFPQVHLFDDGSVGDNAIPAAVFFGVGSGYV
jgi:hypothetical protein